MRAHPRRAAGARLACELKAIRRILEGAFSEGTALGGRAGLTPSAGQCGAAALVVNRRLGGCLVSAIVDGVSHWFNRVEVDGHTFDADVTGDQFGLPTVRVGVSGRAL